MAADTQVTWGDTTITRGHKLIRLPDGGVAGACGPAGECQAAMLWLSGGRKGKKPELTEANVLELRGNGRLYAYTSSEWAPDEVIGPAAIGSGMQAAMAAMTVFGADAVKAVEAAAAVDPSTSAPVESLKIERKQRKK